MADTPPNPNTGNPAGPTGVDPQPAPPPPARKKRSKFIFLIILAILIIGGFIWWFLHRNLATTDDAFIESNVVAISPKVSGYVVDLKVQDNQYIKKGDVIVQIDPRDYQIALDSANANLASAEAKAQSSGQNLSKTKISAPSNIDTAKAELLVAQANQVKSQSDYKRLKAAPKGAISQQQLDNALSSFDTAAAEVAGAQANLKSAQTANNTIAGAASDLKQLQASVDAAKAQVAEAQKNLDDTTVTAPFDGRVTNRGVELGAYVQPGEQLLSLVSRDYWVVANFKENQLKRMRIGQGVDIAIDAFPSDKYHGKIDSFQVGTGSRFSAFPAENATGNFVKIVQRVPVKIIFDQRPPDNLPVGPGMSVEPTVHLE